MKNETISKRIIYFPPAQLCHVCSDSWIYCVVWIFISFLCTSRMFQMEPGEPNSILWIRNWRSNNRVNRDKHEFQFRRKTSTFMLEKYSLLFIWIDIILLQYFTKYYFMKTSFFLLIWLKTQISREQFPVKVSNFIKFKIYVFRFIEIVTVLKWIFFCCCRLIAGKFKTFQL